MEFVTSLSYCSESEENPLILEDEKEETTKEDQSDRAVSKKIEMTQQMVEERARSLQLMHATNYDLYGKRVTVGYDPKTFEAKIVFSSDKKRIELSAQEYRDFDEDGSMWTIVRGRFHVMGRKCVVRGDKSIRVTTLKGALCVVFRDRLTNARITLDSLELHVLFRLRNLISSNLFTLTVNRANVCEFMKQYEKKSVERGCYLEYSDFELPVGTVYNIDYLRLFLEYPLYFSLKKQGPMIYTTQ